MFKKKFFGSSSADFPDPNENQTKFIKERVKIIRKHFPELESTLVEYMKRAAKSRHSTEKIAEAFTKYSKAENVTIPFKLHTADFANILANVGTKQDEQVQALETAVIKEITEYDRLCKNVQSELKSSLSAYNNLKSKTRQLMKARTSQTQRQDRISSAEAEFLKARGESARAFKNLEDQIDIFERKRLNIVRDALLSWTFAELQFHAKALELFTDAYRIAADIDVNINMEEFRDKLRFAKNVSETDSNQTTESVLRLLCDSFDKKPGKEVSSSPSDQSSSRSAELEETGLQRLPKPGKLVQILAGIEKKCKDTFGKRRLKPSRSK